MDNHKDKTVLAQICALQDMTARELKAMWKRMFGTDAPAYSMPAVRKRLSLEIQERAYGGLSEKTKTRLLASLEDAGFSPEDGRRISKPSHKVRRANLPTPGTLVEKEYGGQIFQVLFLANGMCELDGVRYRSPSGAAKKITGRHVNGYAFFNLNPKRYVSKKQKEAKDVE